MMRKVITRSVFVLLFIWSCTLLPTNIADGALEELFVSSKLNSVLGQGQKNQLMKTSINSLPLASSSSLIGNNMAWKLRGLIPSMLMMFFWGSSQSGSALNPQKISLRGPFFQGWLLRFVDHAQKLSLIFIVGSFSSHMEGKYTEHYMFCGIESPEGRHHVEAFPRPDSVHIEHLHTQTSTSNNYQPLNISWTADGIGGFKLSEAHCSVDINIEGLRVKCASSTRLPWSAERANTDGPEGWLAATNLLPCRYFVHSVGSPCDYDIVMGPRCWPRSRAHLTGRGFAHIEGNSGAFFPEGWTWVQGVTPDNDASISFVMGKFAIGPVTPINFILYLRLGQRVVVMRSTDFDDFKYQMDGVGASLEIVATSLSRQSRIAFTVRAAGAFQSDCFGDPIYIPTAHGFSNSPGCRETYTALAEASYQEFDVTVMDYVTVVSQAFPLTALEFGGSFQGTKMSDSRRR